MKTKKIVAGLAVSGVLTAILWIFSFLLGETTAHVCLQGYMLLTILLMAILSPKKIKMPIWKEIVIYIPVVFVFIFGVIKTIMGESLFSAVYDPIVAYMVVAAATILSIVCSFIPKIYKFFLEKMK